MELYLELRLDEAWDRPRLEGGMALPPMGTMPRASGQWVGGVRTYG
jgi:hypothetical protein